MQIALIKLQEEKCGNSKMTTDSRKETPLVSVIVPNFNYAKFLPDCLDSLLAQSYSNIEIIVVDDGSTDESLEVLNGYSKRVRIISSMNYGVNHARNLGLLGSHGDFVAFCDSDDWWEPEKIARQIQLLLHNQKLSLVYCGIRIIGIVEDSFTVFKPKYRGNVADEILHFPTRAIVHLGASTALLRRSYLDSEGLAWNSRLNLPGEDINFFNKIALKSEIDFIDDPLVNYRQHSFSRSKMNTADFISGNRESFIDFISYANGYLKRADLLKSWIRLNLILTKHAALNREWKLTITQLVFFFRLYPSSR
jgi:glycosyltransferase involved in cell wall biosynthesis